MKSVLRFGVRWSSRLPHRREKPVESRAVLARGQPVPSGQQVRRQRAQSALLVVEDLQREPGIQFRIVFAFAYELAVLVMLDEMVIWVAGKSQWIEPECIYRGQLQQPQPGIRGLQMGQIEFDQIVAQEEFRAIRKIVQLGQCRVQTCARRGEDQRLTRNRAHPGKFVDAAILDADFKIQ
jgi:hypothetical protein